MLRAACILSPAALTPGDRLLNEASAASIHGLDPRTCEREPIHTPGAIQPHGALLVARADSLLVSHTSANLAAILGCDVHTVLGQPLEQAIGKQACRALLGRAQATTW
jgi:light-regulated signal transduction histidine kinase (bacteriophytochrome)